MLLSIRDMLIPAKGRSNQTSQQDHGVSSSADSADIPLEEFMSIRVQLSQRKSAPNIPSRLSQIAEMIATSQRCISPHNDRIAITKIGSLRPASGVEREKVQRINVSAPRLEFSGSLLQSRPKSCKPSRPTHNQKTKFRRHSMGIGSHGKCRNGDSRGQSGGPFILISADCDNASDVKQQEQGQRVESDVISQTGADNHLDGFGISLGHIKHKVRVRNVSINPVSRGPTIIPTIPSIIDNIIIPSALPDTSENSASTEVRTSDTPTPSRKAALPPSLNPRKPKETKSENVKTESNVDTPSKATVKLDSKQDQKQDKKSDQKQDKKLNKKQDQKIESEKEVPVDPTVVQPYVSLLHFLSVRVKCYEPKSKVLSPETLLAASTWGMGFAIADPFNVTGGACEDAGEMPVQDAQVYKSKKKFTGLASLELDSEGDGEEDSSSSSSRTSGDNKGKGSTAKKGSPSKKGAGKIDQKNPGNSHDVEKDDDKNKTKKQPNKLQAAPTAARVATTPAVNKTPEKSEEVHEDAEQPVEQNVAVAPSDDDGEVRIRPELSSLLSTHEYLSQINADLSTPTNEDEEDEDVTSPGLFIKIPAVNVSENSIEGSIEGEMSQIEISEISEELDNAVLLTEVVPGPDLGIILNELDALEYQIEAEPSEAITEMTQDGADENDSTSLISSSIAIESTITRKENSVQQSIDLQKALNRALPFVLDPGDSLGESPLITGWGSGLLRLYSTTTSNPHSASTAHTAVHEDPVKVTATATATASQIQMKASKSEGEHTQNPSSSQGSHFLLGRLSAMGGGYRPNGRVKSHTPLVTTTDTPQAVGDIKSCSSAVDKLPHRPSRCQVLSITAARRSHSMYVREQRRRNEDMVELKLRGVEGWGNSIEIRCTEKQIYSCEPTINQVMYKRIEVSEVDRSIAPETDDDFSTDDEKRSYGGSIRALIRKEKSPTQSPQTPSPRGAAVADRFNKDAGSCHTQFSEVFTGRHLELPGEDETDQRTDPEPEHMTELDPDQMTELEPEQMMELEQDRIVILEDGPSARFNIQSGLFADHTKYIYSNIDSTSTSHISGRGGNRVSHNGNKGKEGFSTKRGRKLMLHFCPKELPQ